MKEFNSFLGLAEHLGKIAFSEAVLQEAVLTKATKMIQARAKRKIGHLQPDAPPFVAWEPLADSTIARKEQESPFALNADGNPLLMTGEMRDSIERTVQGHEGHVGSDNDKAVWHELGTSKLPPRSFLGSSAAELAPKIAKMIGHDMFLAVTGKSLLGGAFQITDADRENPDFGAQGEDE